MKKPSSLFDAVTLTICIALVHLSSSKTGSGQRHFYCLSMIKLHRKQVSQSIRTWKKVPFSPGVASSKITILVRVKLQGRDSQDGDDLSFAHLLLWVKTDCQVCSDGFGHFFWTQVKNWEHQTDQITRS